MALRSTFHRPSCYSPNPTTNPTPQHRSVGRLHLQGHPSSLPSLPGYDQPSSSFHPSAVVPLYHRRQHFSSSSSSSINQDTNHHHHHHHHHNTPNMITSFPPHLSSIDAISLSEFNDILVSLKIPNKLSVFNPVGVAVSGGPDSMATALLLHTWIKEYAPDTHLIAFVVDHQIRPESTAESQAVAQVLQERGIRVRRLTMPWTAEEDAAAVERAQARADIVREKRYALLTEACWTEEVRFLALGHHAGDQVETFVLRLARHSLFEGLACMPTLSVLERDVVALRPFRHIYKDRLMATCQAYGVHWVEDPTNVHGEGLRTQIRHKLPVWEEHGITPDMIMETVKHMQHVRTKLYVKVKEFMYSHVSMDLVYGFGSIDLDALLQEPAHITTRVLKNLARYLGGRTSPPRASAVVRGLDNIRACAYTHKHYQRTTFGGCVAWIRKDQVFIVREHFSKESKINMMPLSLGESRLWDGRWQIYVEAPPGTDAEALYVRRLDKDTLARVSQVLPRNTKTQKLPADVKSALPVIVTRDTKVVAIPHLDYRLSGFNQYKISVEWKPRQRQPLMDSTMVFK